MEYWAFKGKKGKITAVESHSYPHKVPGAVKMSKKAFDAYIASLPVVEPEAVRDLYQEIAAIWARLDELETREPLPL